MSSEANPLSAAVAETIPLYKPIPTKVYLNNKGGVAKTTDSSLDAEYSALEEGLRVLLIDWDGQMNLTKHWVGVDEDRQGNLIPPEHPDLDPEDPEDAELYNHRSAITDIFYGKEVLPHSTYIGPDDPDDTTSPRVDIIAGSRKGMYELQQNIDVGEALENAEKMSKGKVVGFSTRKLIARLAEFCSDPQLAAYYDVIIIDAGPSETPLFRAAIQASTHVITPYKPEEYSVMGITTLINNVRAANQTRIGRKEQIKFVGLLPCLVDRGRGGFHEDTIENALRDFGDHHFPKDLLIINTKKISRRQSKDKLDPESIFHLKPSDPIRKDCTAVFKYIHKEVFGDE